MCISRLFVKDCWSDGVNCWPTDTKTKAFQQRIRTYKMTFQPNELESIVTYWATDISSSSERIYWNFWRKDQQNSGDKRKDVWSVNQPFMSTTYLMNKWIWQADETILRDDESLYHPEAAGRRHLWQRADGEKQWVWRTGGYQEVRMLIPFVFKTLMILVVNPMGNIEVSQKDQGCVLWGCQKHQTFRILAL